MQAHWDASDSGNLNGQLGALNCLLCLIGILLTVVLLRNFATILKLHTRQDFGMSEGKKPVIDWDNTVHKNVRSREGEPVGNVVAILGDSIHVETQGSRGQYMIPKVNVARFNGAEITLDVAVNELGKFAR